MAAILLDGRKVSDKRRTALCERVAQLKAQGITPRLTVILVGDAAASAIYVRNKERACDAVGIVSEVIRLEATCTQEMLMQTIDACNADAQLDGILVQLPLPKHLDEAAVLARIDPSKDVDGFHAQNTGKLFSGQAGFVPCTPKGIMEILAEYGIDVQGMDAVIVGRSNIVGKPMAHLLLEKNATVTLCHSRTKDLAFHTQRADILVCALGKAKFITAAMVKPGAVVIDVGINRVDGKIVGDVDFDAVRDIAGYITPVPGGVGPMTITMLLQNTIDSATARRK